MDIINYDEDIRPVVPDATEVEWYGSLDDKPEIEQSLYKMQDAWYKCKNDEKRQDIWREMFSNVRIYARSMVLQKLKNKKFLDPDIIDGHANNAALKFMSQYLYRKNFKCGTSFGKMINYKVLETVYGEIEDDKALSLVLDTDTGDDFDLLSASQKAQVNVLWGKDYEDIEETIENKMRTGHDVVHEMLSEFDEVIDDDLLRLKMRMYFNILLKKPKNRHIKDQFIKQNCLSKRDIDVLNLVELNLYNKFSSYRYIGEDDTQDNTNSKLKA